MSVTGDVVSVLDPVVDVGVVVAAKEVLLVLLLPCLEPQYKPLKLRLAEHDIGGVSGMGPLVLTPSDAKCFLHQSICFVFLLLFVVVEDEDTSAAEDNDEEDDLLLLLLVVDFVIPFRNRSCNCDKNC
jgi:hypothetical protein